MHDRVGRTAERHERHDRVVERRGRENVARLQILPDHLDDAAAARFGHARVIGIDRRNRRGAGQRQAQRLGDAGHGRCGAHRHAVTRGARDAFLDVAPVVLVDVAGAQLRPVLPRVAAAAQRMAVPIAAQHGAARHEDRRQIHRHRAHDQAPGVVLSQPPISTQPSAGYERSSSSVSIARKLRYSIVVGF